MPGSKKNLGQVRPRWGNNRLKLAAQFTPCSPGDAAKSGNHQRERTRLGDHIGVSSKKSSLGVGSDLNDLALTVQQFSVKHGSRWNSAGSDVNGAACGQSCFQVDDSI